MNYILDDDESILSCHRRIAASSFARTSGVIRSRRYRYCASLNAPNAPICSQSAVPSGLRYGFGPLSCSSVNV